MRLARRLVLVVACGLAAACHPAQVDDHQAALRAVLASPPDFVGHSGADARAWQQARRFYQGRRHRIAWLDDGRATRRLDELVHAVASAGEHGLDPASYGAAALREARDQLASGWFGGRVDGAPAARLDARLTYAFLRLAADLANGRVPPGEVSPEYVRTRSREDALALLRQAIGPAGVARTLAGLTPTHLQYVGLQLAVARYRGARHGDAAARSASDWRIRQIEMNLERWRWAARDLGAQHVLVNVAGYELQAIDGYRAVLAMRVAVGERLRPTPLFSDRMTEVVFSPYWNIPGSIAREEALALASRDPGYLARAGIEVVRTSAGAVERVDPAAVDWSRDPVAQGVRLRQAPGPGNALGRVKFVFPNHFDVYLHDTPDPSVFSRGRRAYSHGCVRIEDPVGLAQYVLRDQPQWTRERIVAAMERGQETAVPLSRPIPVHLGYWTAWVRADGTVAFTDDPYDLDRRHDRALRRAGW